MLFNIRGYGSSRWGIVMLRILRNANLALQHWCSDAVGGTLKIFGESLCRDVPYRTLLLSLKDTAAHVVREILEKYGFEKEDPGLYCLVQHIVPHPIQGAATGSMKEYHSNVAGPKEYILDDDDCPLAIDTNFPKSKGLLIACHAFFFDYIFLSCHKSSFTK